MHWAGLEESLAGHGWVQAGSWSAVSAPAKNTHSTLRGNSFGTLVQFSGEGESSICVPGEMSRVSGGKVYVVRAGMLEDASFAYSRAMGGGGTT